MTEQEQDYLRRIHELEQQVLRLQTEIKKNSETQYGLRWMDMPEAFDDKAENAVPILKEVKEKAITSEDGKPTHILIEGDNYHALTCLNYTHKGAIDVIYIDPPYNTGENDFFYRDKRFLDKYPDGTPVPKDHPLRHSYWLSFMYKRLELAKNILSDRGVIFISIDDNEQANLKLLCDKVFGAENFISESFILDNLKGKTNDNFITSVGSRLLMYAKRKNVLSEFGFMEVENVYGDLIENKYKEEDNSGYYNLITFKKTGQAKLRKDRPFMFYPILEKDGVLYAITQAEFDSLYDKINQTFNDDVLDELKKKYVGFNFIVPTDGNGVYLRWTSGFNTFTKKINIDIIYKNGSVMQKTRPSANEMTQIYASGTPKNFMYKPSYSMGTDDLKSVVGDNDFSFPKPIQLLKDIQKLFYKNNNIILDFFAGSGTTMHATMQLNEEDGGHRQCILVTNNENQICEKVTYERNRRVMQGYTNAKGEEVAGLGNSLKYYRTAFVGNHDIAHINDADKVALTQKAGCLLALGENTLEEISTANTYQIFQLRKGDKPANGFEYTAIYFSGNLMHFADFRHEIEALQQTNSLARIAVYVFTWGDPSIFENEFDDLTGITIKPIPQPILEIYQNIHKL